MRTRWRLGLNRRFVATIEWLRLFPTPGPLPQTAQTFDMASSSVAKASAATFDEPVLAGGRGCGTELREQVRHLEARADSLGALVDARLGLLDGVRREEAEGDGNAGLERRELQPRRRLAGDKVEMGRLAADHAAERDDARVPAGLREGHRRQRELERAGHRHDRDRLPFDPGPLELLARRRQQPRSDR